MIQIDGNSTDWLGPAAIIGDVDGDGVDDFVLGAPSRSLVRVYSGSTLIVLYEVNINGECCEGFGQSLSGTGDFDGDGVPDFVTGDQHDDTAIHNGGAVYVLSGVDGSQLALVYGSAYDEGLGRLVAGLGDIDGDGFTDVGAASYTNHVRIYGGPDGHLIREHFGPTISRPSIAGVGDVNGDKVSDYVIGWPQDSTMGAWAGRATVYSGLDGSMIHDVFGQTGAGGGLNGDHLGTSVAGLGDVDGDGIPDFAAGAPGVVCMGSCGTSTQAMVRVYSGSDAGILHEWQGSDHTTSSTGELFGFRVFGAGDLNADGHGDIVVAAPYDDSNNRGSIQMFSGRTGGKLWRVWGEEPGARLRDAAILGDLTGDGIAEFAVGEPWTDHGGSYSGRVTIYAGFPADVISHCDSSFVAGRGSILLDLAGPIGIGNNSASLIAMRAVPGQPAFFFYGAVQPPAPYGGGWLCTASPILRLSPVGIVPPDGTIERTLDFTLPPLNGGAGQVLPGSTWSFQLFCRDPQGPGGSGFDLSDGLAITFPP